MKIYQVSNETALHFSKLSKKESIISLKIGKKTEKVTKLVAVLTLLTSGSTYKQIIETTGVSPNTIRSIIDYVKPLIPDKRRSVRTKSKSSSSPQKLIDSFGLISPNSELTDSAKTKMVYIFLTGKSGNTSIPNNLDGIINWCQKQKEAKK